MVNEETLILEYNLYDLPTTQHKAGLAGLLLMIESMKMRRMPTLPKVLECTANMARFSFTQESIQTLFDDYFDASWEERESSRPRTRKKDKTAIQPKRKEQREVDSKGKKKIKTVFIYDGVVPAGKFLQAFFPGTDGAWIKLWRDMLWNTLRGRPTQKKPYEKRAEQNPSSAGGEEWVNLSKKGGSSSINSTVFIGAQDCNAERVPFQDNVKNNFLLYFWPISSLIFAPRRMQIERKKDGILGVKFEDAGFLITIPEPSNLRIFVEDMKTLLRSLDSKVRGYRPAEALIDVPPEGAFEFFYHLAKAKMTGSEIADSLLGIEIYYLEKVGNNIIIHIANYVVPDIGMLNDYKRFRDRLSNPIYKSIRISNLLAGLPWYYGAELPLNSYPWEFFIGKEGKTPRDIRFFGDDVRKKFQAIERDFEGGEPMVEQPSDDQLALRVYRLVKEFVRRKSEVKSGKKYEKFEVDPNGKKIYPGEYTESQEKICSDAFLAIRGRRAQDFIEYFTGSICSVPQWLPEDDYLAVSSALITDWEKVKTFTLLALSACSYHKADKKNELKQEEGK